MKQYEIQIQLQWNTNRDLHTPYSRVSFRMTLSDVGAIFDDTKHCVISLRQLMSCDTQHCVISFSATADVLWHKALCRFILWDSWCLVTHSTVSFLCDSWCLVTQSTVSFHSLRQLMSCDTQHCVVSFSATADVLWHKALCRFILCDSWCLVLNNSQHSGDADFSKRQCPSPVPRTTDRTVATSVRRQGRRTAACMGEPVPALPWYASLGLGSTSSPTGLQLHR